MGSKPSNQLIGMRGVYLTAAELTRRGFIVSPTSRSAFGADLLVTDQRCRKAWTVQVKATTKPADFCLVGKHAKEVASASHVYVFVTLKEDGQPAKFLVVPSRVVAKKARAQGQGRMGFVFYRSDAAGTASWRIFGNSTPRPTVRRRKRKPRRR
jgi:hypothetical protein